MTDKTINLGKAWCFLTIGGIMIYLGEMCQNWATSITLMIGGMVMVFYMFKALQKS